MIYHGDSLQILTQIPQDSLDSLVTDPPAGISFMGKSWDSDKGGRDQWVAWMRDVMKECLRVLKPGAHGFVWALPRTSHWTATALEDAGFEVRDVVTHLFGSGFPKSMDISKAIDKAAGANRIVIGNNPNHRSLNGEVHKTKTMCGEPHTGDGSITAPATDAAKQWQGWGTALKPASEHWILVRKPLGEKTVAKNVLLHGTGGINIDACRITTTENQGRFPANLVFSHSPYCTETQCDMECAIQSLDEQSGILKSGARNGFLEGESLNQVYGKRAAKNINRFDSSSGGASRFFYCAKISTRERNEGLEGMPDVIEQRYAEGTKRKLSAYGENDKNPNHPRKNSHPTVKPKKLMNYLITMITPPGGTVLDPFMGSGSTGIAALESGFQFVGIEQELAYIEIATKRITSLIAN